MSESSKVYIVRVHNPPTNWERINFYNVFTQFGKVKKLYIAPDQSFANVLFSKKEEAQQAYNSVNNREPDFLKLSFLRDDSFAIEPADKMQNVSFNSFDDTNELLTDLGPLYVDVFGNKIETLVADNNEIFIPLSDLEKCGFKLYEYETWKRNQCSLDMDKIKEHFELYIKSKAYTFLKKNNIPLSDDFINGVVHRNIQTCFPSTNPKSNQSSASQSANGRLAHAKNFNTRPNSFGGKARSDDSFGSGSMERRPFNRGQGNVPSIRAPNVNKIRSHSNGNDGNFGSGNTERRPSSRGHENVSNIQAQNKARNTFNGPVNEGNKEGTSGTDEIIPVNKITLTANTTYQGLICYTSHPTIGYVNLRTNNLEQLFAVAETSLKAAPITPKINLLCAALYERVWYRALVTAVKPAIQVQYIDYGNSNTEPIKEVRRLDQNMCRLPAQAIAIRLENKEDGSLVQDKLVTFRVIKQQEDGTYLVQLAKEEPRKHEVSDALKAKKTVPNSQDQLPRPAVHRKSVIEDSKTRGLLGCGDVIGNDRVIAFVFPVEYSSHLVQLESIAEDCENAPSYTAKVGETVAVQKDDTFVRGTIIDIKNDKYVAALIDYGCIRTVDNIRQLPNKYQSIPEFSCVCNVDSKMLADIKNACEANYEVVDHLKYRVSLEGGKYTDVFVERWDPFKTNQQVSPGKVAPPAPGDIARIVNVTDDDSCIWIRTEASQEVFKALCQRLDNYKGAVLAEKPTLGQMVVCENESTKTLCRAVVKGVIRSSANVLFVDYGTRNSVPIANLFSADDYLKGTCRNLWKCKLDGYDKALFGPQAFKYLKDSIEKVENFTVRSIKDQSVCLEASDGVKLSEKINSVENRRPPHGAKAKTARNSLEDHKETCLPSKIVTINDIKMVELKFGETELFCLSTENLNEGLLTFCPATADSFQALAKLSSQIEELAKGDSEPYQPSQFEVVLAFFEDQWYRATVVAVNKQDYDVYYIDYGNSSTVTRKDIRKLPQSLVDTPSFGLFCLLSSILKDSTTIQEPVLKELRQLIMESEIYKAVVLNKAEHYHIEIPSIMEKLKAKNLV